VVFSQNSLNELGALKIPKNIILESLAWISFYITRN
jgi:hypothetical protein